MFVKTDPILILSMLSLAPFDVGASHALSFAILAHLVNVVPVSILGASFLLLGRESLSLNMGALRRASAIAPAPGAAVGHGSVKSSGTFEN